MLIYLFQTAGSLTTGFERQFRQKIDTYRPITRLVIVQPERLQPSGL